MAVQKVHRVYLRKRKKQREGHQPGGSEGISGEPSLLADRYLSHAPTQLVLP
jgi:hypothetical protein